MALWAMIAAFLVAGLTASTHGLAIVLQDWLGAWGPVRR
jgi:hypothetical protein